MRPPPLAVCALLVLAGCDAFGEPERFYNDDARPPAVGALDLAGLRDGQHVAGNVAFALDLDSLAGRLDRVVLWIDGSEVASLAHPPFRFSIYTPDYAEGEHAVMVGAYVRRPNGGLLNLAGAPAVALTARLVFDQRPPTPVAGLSVSVSGRRPVLRWDENRDPNFHAYVVYRRPASYDEVPWRPGPEVATITDRAQTTFLDGDLDEIYGAGAVYHVAVSNRAEVSDPGQPGAALFSAPLLSLRSISGRAAISADGSETYTISGSRLVAVSTRTGAVVRSLDLGSDYSLYTPTRDDVRFDPASGRLYFTVGQGGVWVLEASTFAEVGRYPLPFGATRFVVDGDRLYAVGGSFPRALHVLDATSGAALASAGVGIGWLGAEVAGLSPDGRSAYVMDQTAGRLVLVRIDVSGDVPRAVERRVLGYGSEWSFGVTPDGRVLVHAYADVEVLDGTTLQSLGKAVPAIENLITTIPVALDVVGDRFYVAYPGAVVEFETASLAQRRTWLFAGGLRGLAASPGGQMAVFGYGGGWAIPL